MAEGPKNHHVHCDESQTGARFVVYGGIITSGRNVDWFDGIMAKWRDDNHMHAELKWTKVTNQKYAQYKALVDLFFEHAALHRLHFKSVVFDSTEVDYAYHDGDEELGFYKFYYQFLLHKFGVYAKSDEHSLYVSIDERSTTKYKLGTLKDVLNAGIRKKFGRNSNVVKQVEPACSKHSNLMQMADVLMGAVGWHSNDLADRPDARRAKIDLANYIAQKAKLGSLKHQTPYEQREFEIWRFKFSRPKQAKK
ncbi:MAG: DUF3800 domain-containing protein [Acidobacteria bacterium]|nr:DUF3800 domain-containing protein [Acidobacteriota bacterium]